jgi:hypothetical protein
MRWGATLSSTFRIRELSVRTWIIAIGTLIGFGVVLRVVVMYVFWKVFGRLWVDWGPGRIAAHYLIGTPLEELAASVRWFITIYLPDCIFAGFAAIAIGYTFSRKWLLMTLVFLFGFVIASHFAKVSTASASVAAVRASDWSGAFKFAVFTVLIYGAVLLGGALGSWVSRRHRYESGYCQRCGYSLSGLPEPRCPECGTPFTTQEVTRTAQTS